MTRFWIRNKKGQVAAEVGEAGLSVHDQTISWKLQELKEAGAFPFNAAGSPHGRAWSLDAMLRFFEQSGYTIERKDT